MMSTQKRSGQKFNPAVLTALRTIKGLSKEEFGARIGYTGALVGQLERGATRPSLKVLEKIAAEFDVDLRSFFA